MVLAATSDAVVGAYATVTVGVLAAVAAIVVALLQNRSNSKRDVATEKVLELARELTAMEHERAEKLAEELQRHRNGGEDDEHA